jgi:hypothetical protein
MGHMATLEPFPAGWWAQWLVAKPEPSRIGSESGATRHVVTPEPFPVGWHAQCHRARDGARALLHRERVWSCRDTR